MRGIGIDKRDPVRMTLPQRIHNEMVANHAAGASIRHDVLVLALIVAVVVIIWTTYQLRQLDQADRPSASAKRHARAMTALGQASRQVQR